MSRPQIAAIRPDIRRYGDLTSLEIERAKQENTLLILPVGATEQHGDGLPLSTDNIRAEHVAMRLVEDLAAEAADHKGDTGAAAGRAYVLPTLGYGISPHHTELPGTISLDPRLFIDIVTSVAGQLAEAGFRRILVITGHGGNIAGLGVAAQVLLASHPDLVFAHSPVSALATEASAALSRTEVSGHCGESETAQMLAIDPALVDSPHLSPGATSLDELSPRARLSRTKTPASAVTFDRYAENGVLGDPRTATAEDGQRILDEIHAKLLAYSRRLLDL